MSKIIVQVYISGNSYKLMNRLFFCLCLYLVPNIILGSLNVELKRNTGRINIFLGKSGNVSRKVELKPERF